VKNDEGVGRCRIIARYKAMDEAEVAGQAFGPRNSSGL
jgi:hypothetical protein